MKRFLFTSIIILFSYVKISATAQIPDIVYYNGNKYDLLCNPLERYFNSHPDKRPATVSSSTALERGYRATFEIQDGTLHLKDIQIIQSPMNDENRWKSVMSEIFPDSELKKINWFTGLLRIPVGKLKKQINMGYESVYEKYLLLEVKGGKLLKEKQLADKDYKKFKEKQLYAFKKAKEYNELISFLKKSNPSIANDEIDTILTKNILDYSPKIYTE